MATKAKTTTKRNTSLVKNTARGITLKGNTAKTSTYRRNKTRRATTNARKTVRSRRKNYRRNSAASATAGLFAAFGGALVINSFDLVINRFAPNVSGLVRTCVKFGAGFLVGAYGGKVGFLKGFAPMISNALYLAGALDLVGTYIMPKLTQMLDQAQASVSNALVGTGTTVTDSTTGQLGKAFYTRNGDRVEIYARNQTPRGGLQRRIAYP